MWMGMRMRPSCLGWSFVHTRCDPQIVVGRMGTDASLAIRTVPDLNSLSSKDREIVASGNTPTISPARSASTAARNDAAPACRSTGMCFIPRMSGPAYRWPKMLSLAMNRTYRRERRATRPA